MIWKKIFWFEMIWKIKLLKTDLLLTFNSGRANKSVTIFGFPFATAKYNGVLLNYWNWNFINLIDLKLYSK